MTRRSTNALLLTPGDWHLAVVNRDPTDVTYSVCATEYVIGTNQPGGIIRLTNAVPYANLVLPSNNVASSGRDYYVFTVSSNAVQADFETFGASGNVDLYLRHGVPLPTESVFGAASVNGGATNEIISLNTNSATPPFTLEASKTDSVGSGTPWRR